MILPRTASRAEFSSSKMTKLDLCTGAHLFAGLNCFEPGQEHAAHVHAGQDKLYYVLEGAGEAVVGEERSAVTAGDLVLAPAGVSHSMRNPGPARLVVMVVFAPPPRPHTSLSEESCREGDRV
jgi:mannose-6-phosphate isomerase-like protein (cupin superfamily)